MRDAAKFLFRKSVFLSSKGWENEHSRRFLISTPEVSAFNPSSMVRTHFECEKSQLTRRYQHMIKHNQRFRLISFIPRERNGKSSEPRKHAIFICSLSARKGCATGGLREDWMEACFDVVMFVSIKEITSSTSRCRLATTTTAESLSPSFVIRNRFRIRIPVLMMLLMTVGLRCHHNIIASHYLPTNPIQMSSFPPFPASGNQELRGFKSAKK